MTAPKQTARKKAAPKERPARKRREVTRLEIAGTAITHPEKVLFPEDGITKGELAAYYEAIAPLMLPHLRGRPITMDCV